MGMKVRKFWKTSAVILTAIVLSLLIPAAALAAEPGGDGEIFDGTITVTAESGSKVYDGAPLTDAGYTVDGLPEGYSLTAEITGSQTEAGSSQNAVSGYTITKDGVDITDSMRAGVVTADGTLTVTKRPVTIKAVNGSFRYDAKPHYVNLATVVSGSVAKYGHTIFYEVTGSRTEAGSSASSIVEGSVKVINTSISGNREDLTANYDVACLDGTLTVSKRPLVITGASAEKVYDGMPLTEGGYTAGALPEGHSVSGVKMTGSQTDYGVSLNTPSGGAVFADGTDVTANYDIQYRSGKLSVSKGSFTLKATDGNYTYDAKPHDAHAATVRAGSVSPGQYVTYKVKGSQTDAGSSASVVDRNSVKVTDRDGRDFTKNYAITLVDGKLTVRPREITVTGAYAAKRYDGTPLTNDGYTVSILPAGHKVVDVTVTGSQTEYGVGLNTPSGAKVFAGDRDVTANYNIVYRNGRLTVR